MILAPEEVVGLDHLDSLDQMDQLERQELLVSLDFLELQAPSEIPVCQECLAMLEI